MPQKKYYFTEEEIKDIQDSYVNDGLSYKELMLKYNIKCNNVISKILGDLRRNTSEANKLAHIHKPEAFKHTEESKQKIREARLKFMKEHPEETAWRKGNFSYPEKQFVKFLEERGYASKFLIERELSVFPYYIDFAFSDLNIAIEIDGSQHLEEERKKRDEEKDKLLQDNGWTVIRIAENIVKNYWDILEKTLNKYINKETTDTFEKIGIVKAVKKVTKKKERNESGRTEKEQKRHDAYLSRLPDKDVLLEQITNNSFTIVAKIYNVSDKCISKWCKTLGLPSTKKELGQRPSVPIPEHICKKCGKTFKTDDRNSMFCSRACYNEYMFEHSKLAGITKDIIQSYIDNKVKLCKACEELGIIRQDMYKLCKRYGIVYKIK